MEEQEPLRHQRVFVDPDTLGIAFFNEAAPRQILSYGCETVRFPAPVLPTAPVPAHVHDASAAPARIPLRFHGSSRFVPVHPSS